MGRIVGCFGSCSRSIGEKGIFSEHNRWLITGIMIVLWLFSNGMILVKESGCGRGEES